MPAGYKGYWGDSVSALQYDGFWPFGLCLRVTIPAKGRLYGRANQHGGMEGRWG